MALRLATSLIPLVLGTLPVLALASTTSLSQDQQNFESFELQQGGSDSLSWNLPYGGATLASNSGYSIYAQASGGLTQSPLTAGPQIQWPTLEPIDPALPIPPSTPSRILKSGQVVLLPATAPEQISYVDGKVQVDFLTMDGLTTLSSRIYSSYSVTPLSGYMENAPEDFQQEIPIEEWIGAGLFGSTAKWSPGAAYLKRSGTRNGEVIYAEDCIQGAGSSQDSSALPLPCMQSATIEQIFPINLGTRGVNGPETDFLADGTISELEGVRIWVANAPLPQEQYVTEAYRVFFELGGNVYRGYLQKDGTPLLNVETDGGAVDYTILLNAAAVRSFQSGLITGAVTAGSKAGTPELGPTIDIFGIGGHGPNGSLSPADLKAHYNIPANLTGAGQTIAIVDGPGSGDVEDDLGTFSQFYGLPPCTSASGCFQHIDLSNGAAVVPANDWAGEVALDTQMAHAIAPGAKIILVTALSGNGVDLMNAVATAAALPGVTTVSMSFGAGTANRAIVDPQLAAFQAKGMVFFGSSGDSGNIFSINYPATSPYVTAVGGTQINSVSWNGSALPASDVEVAWEFSGGGEDVSYPMPAWQLSFLSHADIALVTSHRAFPDVSSVADWRHSAVSSYYKQGWHMTGGTSAGTPFWAGVSALFAQYLANEGKSLPALVIATPGGFNGLLYQAKLFQQGDSAFHDITQGSNNVTGKACSFCTATPGYDNVTGLGSPDVTKLFSYF